MQHIAEDELEWAIKTEEAPLVIARLHKVVVMSLLFIPKKIKNFSPSRFMGSDMIHETTPKGLFKPVILLEGIKITEANYLKLLREDYPMDEIFIEKEEAVERFGDDSRGGAILPTSIGKD